MNRLIHLTSCLGLMLLLSVLFITGCSPAKDGGKDTTTNAKEKEKKKEHKHGHVGPHGGPLAEWDDIYHAEFTVDHATKTAVVYVLDDEGKFAPKIDPAKITKVLLSITSVKPILNLEMKHDAKLSGDKGIAFVVTHDVFAQPTKLKGSIDGVIKLDKELPYGGPFEYKPSDQTKAAKLRELYLTPGGIYTVADIKANGNTVPEEKFKGKIWEHADDVKAGDKVCPVTKNKAEAECAWIVQGQRYEFCCPPCLDKFISLAHHQPEKIKNSKDYVFAGK